MVFDHVVKVGHIFYEAGENVPIEEEIPVKEEPVVKQEEVPAKRRGRRPKEV